MKRAKTAFVVRTSTTVSAEADGHRITSTQRGETLRLQANNHEHAIRLAEREQARRLARRYSIEGNK